MIDGDQEGLHLLDESEFDAESWKGRVQCDKDVTLSGHSFGGATAVRPYLGILMDRILTNLNATK